MPIFFNSLLYLILSLIYLLKKNKLGLIKYWLLLFLFFSLPFPIKNLLQQRESHHPPLTQIDTTLHYHILVLGAGKNDDTRLVGNQRLSEQALVRLVEGVKWAHRLPQATLIGSGPQGKGDKSQAQHMAETAQLLGVAKERIYVQQAVHNTRTEAEAYVQQFGTETPLILCTSALHMPRAVKWFEYYGVQTVIPAPASYQAPKNRITWKDFVPSVGSFGKWQAWGKEGVGELLIVNWFRR